MRGRRRWGARASLGLALFFLFALGVGSAQALPVGQSATIKLTMYTHNAGEPALKVLIPSFEQANPDIDVTVTPTGTAGASAQLQATQLAAGGGPDILSVWPGCGTSQSVCRLAPAGHLANMPAKPW